MQRSTESRMDYEYDNKSGPVDQASPFLKFAAQAQLQKARGLATKRSFTDFKTSNQFDTFPNLRSPTSQPQTFLFSQPQFSSAKPLPAVPYSAFNTPRKLEIEYDSSGVENPSSPEYPDSEATPENMGLRSGLAKATAGVARMMGDPKEKPMPFFKSGRTSPSKPTVLQPRYSHTIEKRRKRIKKDSDKQIIIRKGSSASEDEEDTQRTDKKQPLKSPVFNGPSQVASLFSFIESHPNLPHILSFYAQLLLNVFLVFFLIYIIYSFWTTIQSDVDKKSEEAVAEILGEMALCAASYRENKCEKETRLPALEIVCQNWEKCMTRDPRAVGRAKVSAHTFAEIFNSFIEPISYKAMIFSMVLVFGCVAISNFAFGFFRNKAPHPQPPYAPYMQTPMRHASGPQDAYWNGYQSPMPREPAPSLTAGEPQTPSRRLEFK